MYLFFGNRKVRGLIEVPEIGCWRSCGKHCKSRAGVVMSRVLSAHALRPTGNASNQEKCEF